MASKQVRYKPKTGYDPDKPGRPQAFDHRVERVTMSIYTSAQQYDAVVRRTLLRGIVRHGRRKTVGISEIVREAIDLYLRTVPEKEEENRGKDRAPAKIAGR